MEKNRCNLVKLVDNGLTNIKIGELYGVSRDTIRRWLKIYDIERVVETTHPNLIVDYFETIDTKDKAYWLGYLSADGYVDKDGSKLVLDLANKDKELLFKFCDAVGANKDKISERIHKCGSISNKIVIYGKGFVNHLILLGCTNNKSFTLKLNDFNDEKLDLAYLMGYYDGDGFANSSQICGASKDFMYGVKIKYNLKFNPKERNGLFTLNLGASLKRKLLINYENSLPRKRLLYDGDKSYKTNGIEYPRIKKFNVDKETLTNLLDIKSYVEIGKMFGVSDNSIRKRAKKLGIILKPSRRYCSSGVEH